MSEIVFTIAIILLVLAVVILAGTARTWQVEAANYRELTEDAVEILEDGQEALDDATALLASTKELIGALQESSAKKDAEILRLRTRLAMKEMGGNV